MSFIVYAFVIIKCGTLCTIMYLDPVTICTDGAAEYLCPCIMLVYTCVTNMKFRVVSGIFTVLSYIGQCDLHNTCLGFPGVWYTPGGSLCRICYLTSKESIFTLIKSY